MLKPALRILIAISLISSVSAPAIAANSAGIELTNFQATGQDVVVGTEATNAPYGNQVLDYSGEINFTFTGSYKSARFSFLNYEAKSSLGNPPSKNFIFTLDHPTSPVGKYTDMNADGSISLSIHDAGYATPINDNLTYIVGMRMIEYSTEINALVDTTERLNISTDSSLIGFRAALEMKRVIFDIFSIETTVALSLLQGTNEFDYFMDSSPPKKDFGRHLKADVLVPGYEVSVRGIYHLGSKARLWLGYDMMRFQRMASYQVFTDDVNDATQVSQGVDAGFHGIKFGFDWSF